MGKRKIKILASLLVLLLAFPLNGCAGGSREAAQGSITTQTADAAKQTAKATTEDKKAADADESKSEIPDDLLPSDGDDDASASSQSWASGDSTTSKSTVVYDGGSAKSSASGSGSSSSGSGSSSGGSSSSNQNSGNTGSQSNSSKIHVTMSIDGSAATNGNAVSLGTTNITLKSGQTVYDALVKSGVSFSGSSSYVAGIGGLFEKDCGPMSGWTYTVNGAMPNVGCGSYQCKDGDSIVWTYVLSY